MRLCSKFLLLSLLLAAGPVVLNTQASSSQATPAQAQPAPATEPSPQAPETQPPLTLDRDPVLSPDPADNAAVNPAHPNPGLEVKKDHGVYTLRRDVDEVLLPAP